MNTPLMPHVVQLFCITLSIRMTDSKHNMLTSAQRQKTNSLQILIYQVSFTFEGTKLNIRLGRPNSVASTI